MPKRDADHYAKILADLIKMRANFAPINEYLSQGAVLLAMMSDLEDDTFMLKGDGLTMSTV